MNQLDLLLKIGGSVLTDKQKINVFHEERMAQICKVIKQLNDNGLNMLIVTGVGNVGHQAVFKYGIHKGDDGSLERKIGLVESQIGVNRLRNSFLKALFNAGIPAIQFYASSICTMKNRIPQSFYVEPINHFCDLGFVPVTSGDVVYDSDRGFSVISGDLIIQQIIKHLGAKIVAYGTDVAGIYTDDPKSNPNAQLITNIDSQQITEVLQGVTEGKTIDVSGAMKGKFKVILSTLKDNPKMKIHLFDLTQPKNILKIVNDEDFAHTIVHL